MSLQEIFYLLAIAFFVSGWVVLIALGVAVFVVYRRLQQLQSKIHGAATSIPVLTIVLPIVGKVFRWWRHR